MITYSKRIRTIQLESENGKINLIQINALTTEKLDQKNEKSYNQTDIVLRGTTTGYATINFCDFSVKIGKGKVGEYVFEYDLCD